ncbi:hypothetical protein [Massilia sp. CCM 8734]|uniref:hypothetical protein n=1 Tax=Massilia sp. CCM 8734 TaxID=2609283 RepID=UPI0014247516|nr:hypothetical protein [Massilia sp. CCM 8734]NHZ97484.1 hypothetical protein [Massilia sp. CCM 8734]
MSIFVPPYVTLDEAVSLLAAETGAQVTRDWVLQLVRHGDVKFFFRPQSDLYVSNDSEENSFLHMKPGQEHPLPNDWAEIFTADVNHDGKIQVRTLPDALGKPRFIQDAKTCERVVLAISIDDVRFSSDELAHFAAKRMAKVASAGVTNSAPHLTEKLGHLAGQSLPNQPLPKRAANRISVSNTLRLILEQAEFPPTMDILVEVVTDEHGNETALPGGKMRVVPSDGRGLAAQFIKANFLSFCKRANVQPTSPYSPCVFDYDCNNEMHDLLYEISQVEMYAFADIYGLDLRANNPRSGDTLIPAESAALSTGEELRPDERQRQKVAACADRRSKLDLHEERGTKRQILECWDNIERLHGPTVDGTAVMRVLVREHGASEVKELKTIRNTLIQLRSAGLIP